MMKGGGGKSINMLETIGRETRKNAMCFFTRQHQYFSGKTFFDGRL